MTDVRLPAPPPVVPQVPLALKRRVKHGIVAGYIRELSRSAGRPAAREHQTFASKDSSAS